MLGCEAQHPQIIGLPPSLKEVSVIVQQSTTALWTLDRIFHQIFLLSIPSPPGIFAKRILPPITTYFSPSSSKRSRSHDQVSFFFTALGAPNPSPRYHLSSQTIAIADPFVCFRTVPRYFHHAFCHQWPDSIHGGPFCQRQHPPFCSSQPTFEPSC